MRSRGPEYHGCHCSRTDSTVARPTIQQNSWYVKQGLLMGDAITALCLYRVRPCAPGVEPLPCYTKNSSLKGRRSSSKVQALLSWVTRLQYVSAIA